MPESGGQTRREQVLLNQNELAEGQTYFSLGNLAVSHDEALLAFSTNTDGDETYTVRVKDLQTGAVLPDEIPNTYYSFAWANDNRTFFYVTLDAAKRPYRIWRHQLGDAESTLVYEETDERFELSLKKSRDGAFVLIESESKITSEVLFLRADDPLGTFQTVWPRRENVLYEVETARRHVLHQHQRPGAGLPPFASARFSPGRDRSRRDSASAAGRLFGGREGFPAASWRPLSGGMASRRFSSKSWRPVNGITSASTNRLIRFIRALTQSTIPRRCGSITPRW